MDFDIICIIKSKKGKILKFFLKHQQSILRGGGGVMLLIGFIIHFWVVPQKGLSKSDLAAARIARMEASVNGKNSHTPKKAKHDASSYTKALKDTQKKQMEYLTILVMIIGVASLAYSFKPRSS